MLTRNELLDKLISALSYQQDQLYINWCERDTLSSWKQSYEGKMYDSLEKEIEELEKQYD